MAIYGYRIVREGTDTVLAVDTRSVSKARGLLLLITSSLFGLFFLGIAVTSHNDRVLATIIFLFSMICVVGSVYLIKKIVVRHIAFTPDTVYVDGAATESHSFDLSQIEGFSSVRETLRMKYGSEQVNVLRRIPNVAAVQTQAALLLEKYKFPKR